MPDLHKVYKCNVKQIGVAHCLGLEYVETPSSKRGCGNTAKHS